MTHLLRRLGPVVPALSVATIAFLALAACSRVSPEDTETETVVPVTTAPATIGDITARVHATGLVVPAPGAELIVTAPEPARIAELPKAEGDVVRRGDVLVRFEIPSSVAEASKQRAEISRAEARLANARAAETRRSDLFQRGVASRKEVEDATREVADAQADLAGAHAAAEAAVAVAARSVVRATFDGLVSRRAHNPGDLVDANAADPVLRVVDPRRFELVAQVPLADASRVRVGAIAHLAHAGEKTPDVVALTVVSRPAAVQEGTATVPVRLAFKDATEYAVGTPLEVDIDTETRRNVVLVPAAAVVHEGEEAAVFVAAGEKAERRVVMVGAADTNQVEVTSGVRSGEVVIITNQTGLPDGAAIRIVTP